MTFDGSAGGGGARPGWSQSPDPDDDDLDRAFGHDTESVGTVTPRQRVRKSALVGLFVIVVTAVLAVVLFSIIGSVQNGVGGVFPRPDAALERFGSSAKQLSAVEEVTADDPIKNSFASYDVESAVRVSADLSEAEQTSVVRGLVSAAGDTSGNGVQVFAVAAMGAIEVGVSADPTVTEKRLALARQLDAIGGVSGVRCSWGDGGPSDDPADQSITVTTHGTGKALGAIMAKATQETRAVFPGATVTSAAP